MIKEDWKIIASWSFLQGSSFGWKEMAPDSNMNAQAEMSNITNMWVNIDHTHVFSSIIFFKWHKIVYKTRTNDSKHDQFPTLQWALVDWKNGSVVCYTHCLKSAYKLREKKHSQEKENLLSIYV